jgi:hypothetical protein
MRVYLLLVFFSLPSIFGFCQTDKVNKKDDEVIIITQKINQKYDLTATFYGINFRSGENDEVQTKIITYIVFKDNKNGKEVRYKPQTFDNSNDKGIDSIITPNFYFTEVWSPDEEYIVLPVGQFEGFAVFKANNAFEGIKENKYFDTIKVKSENSGWFSHDFEKWEDDSTISFRAGLYGDMFAFKYNVKNKELSCYQLKCEEKDIGINNKGKIKAIKKGEIDIIKRY